MIDFQPPTATCQVPGCTWRFESTDPHVLQEAVTAHMESHMGAVEGWTIRVWNGQARLARVIPRGQGGYTIEEVDLRLFPPSVRPQMHALILESVRRAGGGLTQSGQYPPLPDLLALLSAHPPARERARNVQITLYPEDLAALERLQKLLGVAERSGVIRVAIRLALRALQQP